MNISPWISLLALLSLVSCTSSKKIPTPLDPKEVSVFTTAMNTEYRISKTATTSFAKFGQPFETQVCVFVDPSKTFQTFLGIGGAITDASAETLARLSQSKQDEIMNAYYNKQSGIGYTLARTTIHSCDFSSGSYTYINDHDTSLSSFNIDHDRKFRLPMIKKALSISGGLTMYVSPWSPPSWMKDNNSMLKGGKLLPQFRQSWANYYVKYISELEKEGVPVWGLSVQNEPMAKQTWESCIFTGEEERDFIREYLGPTLLKSGMKDKKLIAWDHNRDLIYQRASTVLDDPEAAKYVWGIGYHWYETWTGSDMQFENLKRVAETYPSKNLIFTEGTVEKFDFAKINDWSLGERYGYSMVHDFNAGTVGWTDWNVLLDETGGPNHAGNLCYAPVIADTRNGQVHYTNSFYYIGHFSKFIKPGAKRIIASSNRDLLETTAFINPDGRVVVIVLNRSNQPVEYRLWVKGKAAEVKSLARSIQSLVF